MKKVLITLTLLLTLGMTTEMVAQKHRHTPQAKELVDSTSKDAVEVYSDTTSASTTVADTDNDDDWTRDDAQYPATIMDHMLDKAAEGSSEIAGMFFVLAVLLIIFVVSPVFIIIALFYFINKNRKDKMRLAQMAMQQGQPIPDKLLEEQVGSGDEDFKKGMRQCFIGVGLMIFLGFAAGTIGFGVGALVFCIGLGKIVAVKMAQKNDNWNMNNDLDIKK